MNLFDVYCLQIAYKYPINIAYPFRIKAISNKMVSFFQIRDLSSNENWANIYFHALVM